MKFCKVCRHGLKGQQKKFCSNRCIDIAKAFRRRIPPRKCQVCFKWISRGKWCSKECVKLDRQFKSTSRRLKRINKEILQRVYKTRMSMRPKVWKI